MGEEFNGLIDAISYIRVRDIIDVIIVALAIYKIFTLIKQTRAEQLMKGVLAIFTFSIVSRLLNLYTVSWILEKAMTAGFILFIVVFQPELRRMLEYIGTSNLFRKSFIDIQYETANEIVEEVSSAMGSLSRQKIGALLVFENKTGLNEVIETGTRINSDISSELLINIFIPNTPLHDGAVIIRKDKIVAASCFLPMSDSQTVSKELGTRHRAALGMSERSDSLSIIVSEETGTISVADKGELKRYVDIETLKEILFRFYNVDWDDEKGDNNGKDQE